MDDILITGILAATAVIIIVSIVFIITVSSNGGFAIENTYKMCSGEGKEVWNPFFILPVNACVIKDCSQEYNGITYCTKKIFNVCGNDFCTRSRSN